MKKRGNCYVTSEALFHLLGGKRAGYQIFVMKHEGDTHWFLRDSFGSVIDPTVKQFKTMPNYCLARRTGFLTKKPSKRAKVLMKELLWQ